MTATAQWPWIDRGRSRLMVCFDTAHSFARAAGSPFDRTSDQEPLGGIGLQVLILEAAPANIAIVFFGETGGAAKVGLTAAARPHLAAYITTTSTTSSKSGSPSHNNNNQPTMFVGRGLCATPEDVAPSFWALTASTRPAAHDGVCLVRPGVVCDERDAIAHVLVDSGRVCAAVEELFLRGVSVLKIQQLATL